MKKAKVNQKVIKELSGWTFFSHMKEEDMTGLLEDERVSRTFFAKDDLVSGEKASCRGLAFILSGKAKVSTAKGKAVRELKAGNVFGPAAMFAGDEPAKTEITAMSGSEIVMIPEEMVEDLIRSDPDFAMAYVRFLSGRIRFLNQRIALLTSGESRDTLLSYLLNEADRRGPLFRLPVSLTELAEMLDIGRSSLYRSFEELEAEGVLIRQGRRITLLKKQE